MDNDDRFYHRVAEMEKEQRRKERKEKWAKREKSFWKAFLFTENGKPKSALVIYTFFLSVGMLVLYFLAFNLIIEGLTPVMAGLPPFLSNLLQSLAAGVIMLLAAWVLHRVLKDKRLMFGTYLWLSLYAVAMLITMLILLRGTGAEPEFLVFFAWFALIPLILGLVGTYLLYRKDYTPKNPDEGAEWKKYINPR